MNEKDQRLAGFCRKHGYDGVLIRRRSNIAWAADGADVHCDRGTPLGVASLLWTPQRKTVLTTNIEDARLAAEEFNGEWEINAEPWWTANGRPKGNFATDYPDDTIAELRFSLTPRELEQVKALGHDTADIMSRVMREICPGQTERDVAADMIAGLRRRDIFCPVLLVAADERIALYRHPIPTSKRIEKAALVVLCAQRRGLIVCISRMVHFGPLPADLRRRHDAVCRVDEALQEATRPGVRWCDALAAGIRAYEETGFADEWKKHHQGGPMGYETRDFLVTPSETRVILPNQVIGWNPTITGTKSEDTTLSSGENLTAMPNWPLCGSRPDILCR